METMFEELKQYVMWSAVDEAALHALHPVCAPELVRIADIFYLRILAQDGVRVALQGGEGQVGRLKVTLVAWMDRLLQGPWDEDYFALRCRIGRVHVGIALPQHYMFGAMNVIRRELKLILRQEYEDRPADLGQARDAVDKILDLELAILLHTYREDLLFAVRQAVRQVESQKEKQQLARRAQVAEKLAAVATLAAGLSHEIKNPLNAASLQLTVLERRLRRLPEKSLQSHLEPLALVQQELQRLSGAVEEFLAFARPRDFIPVPVDLTAVVTTVARLFAAQAETAGLRLETQLAPVRLIEGDAGLLQQAVTNLVLNAIQATPAGGWVRIEVGESAGDVVLRVQDSGAGLSEEARSHLFEPFFTTKELGSGLGLPQVHAVVEQHGGSVSVQDENAGGACFVVKLPAHAAA